MLDDLRALERELAEGDGDVYRRLLADEAVVIVPGARLAKEECAAAIDAAERWDELALADEQAVPVGADAALLTYRFDGRRGEQRYAALMSSVWVRRDSGWRLALHQQTPLG